MGGAAATAHLFALALPLISRAERGGWVAEQKAAGFGVLVVVFGVRSGGEKREVSESSSAGEAHGVSGEARRLAGTWQQGWC